MIAVVKFTATATMLTHLVSGSKNCRHLSLDLNHNPMNIKTPSIPTNPRSFDLQGWDQNEYYELPTEQPRMNDNADKDTVYGSSVDSVFWDTHGDSAALGFKRDSRRQHDAANLARHVGFLARNVEFTKQNDVPSRPRNHDKPFQGLLETIAEAAECKGTTSRKRQRSKGSSSRSSGKSRPKSKRRTKSKRRRRDTSIDGYNKILEAAATAVEYTNRLLFRKGTLVCKRGESTILGKVKEDYYERLDGKPIRILVARCSDEALKYCKSNKLTKWSLTEMRKLQAEAGVRNKSTV